MPTDLRVSAFTHADSIILGHLEVADKSNEIPAVQSLIASLGLSGRVFTLDAMHCKKNTCHGAFKGADVVVQVKENQPELLVLRQRLPHHQKPAQQHIDHDKGHGRIEARTIDAFIAPDAWRPEGWQPLVQTVVNVVRVVEHKRKEMAQTSEETAWWISTAALSAAQFQHAIRGHCSIENQNHHVRDVTMSEDASRICEQPGIFARLRPIALNCRSASKEASISRAIYRNTLNFDHAVSVAHGRT